jgi:hypothetical protein
MGSFWSYKDGEMTVGNEEADGCAWYISLELRDGEKFCFKLYEIPIFGGKPMFVEKYEVFDDALDRAKELT